MISHLNKSPIIEADNQSKKYSNPNTNTISQSQSQLQNKIIKKLPFGKTGSMDISKPINNTISNDIRQFNDTVDSRIKINPYYQQVNNAKKWVNEAGINNEFSVKNGYALGYDSKRKSERSIQSYSANNINDNSNVNVKKEENAY